MEDINVDFTSSVSVVVGPNAVGKTTLLEALRFAKAILAPRTTSEANQAALSLGAITQFNAQALIAQAIARDITKPVLIRGTFKPSAEELSLIDQSISAIASTYVLGSLGRTFSDVSDRVAALSSPDGVRAVTDARDRLMGALQEIRSGARLIRLELRLDSSTGVSSGDQEGAAFFAFLDRRLSPYESLFSYFPADRAIPSQEPAIQIGPADAQQQMESHNSQPQLKYQRLKNTIFNTVIQSESGRGELKNEFDQIFDRLLKGRRLQSIGVSENGMLTILIEDTELQRSFSIDAMSSGEKGLILLFLLLYRSVTPGGLVLLDEPELHLNPAVCKNLLSFIVDQYANGRNLQFIICSHSPEVLSSAFERDDCSLYHLRDGNNLTIVRSQDQEEVTDALRRLGTSQSEGLLYRATVFVEGEHDSEVLEIGFEKLFRRYKLRDLGGRNRVESEILALQEAERRGSDIPSQYFIFDRDEAPTGLSSSPKIRILQWQRRCLENYLLDMNILTDLLKERDIAERPVQNMGETQNIIKNLAMNQIQDLVVREVYATYRFENPGLRSNEVQGKQLHDVAEVLFVRLAAVRSQTSNLDQAVWTEDFVSRCGQRILQIREQWEVSWVEDCDGKRLFVDIQKSRGIKRNLLAFKRLIISQMRASTTETWRSMESLIKDLLAVTNA